MDRLFGLVIDERTQGMLTNEQLDAWLAEITPLLREKLGEPA